MNQFLYDNSVCCYTSSFHERFLVRKDNLVHESCNLSNQDFLYYLISKITKIVKVKVVEVICLMHSLNKHNLCPINALWDFKVMKTFLDKLTNWPFTSQYHLQKTKGKPFKLRLFKGFRLQTLSLISSSVNITKRNSQHTQKSPVQQTARDAHTTIGILTCKTWRILLRNNL